MKMDNLDDSESNVKVSDSAYSNSCSNSQSRRSLSTKSTHSGSHSSGSSGYGGGKPSASGYSPKSSGLVQPSEKRCKDKDTKNKKVSIITEVINENCDDIQTTSADNTSIFEISTESNTNALQTSEAESNTSVKGAKSMDISTSDKNSVHDESNKVCESNPPANQLHCISSRPTASGVDTDGFSCVISMHDGVVMYTTGSLTTSLGYPKDMWIGRSFIDFVHPRDQDTFASQITNGLAVPKNENGTQNNKVNTTENSISSMVCRIRRYRSLSFGFGVKDMMVTYMPFLLKLFFKNINDEEGNSIYLVIQASPFFSAFKTPNEMVSKAMPFVIRHSANGNLEYIDPESVPYLGYLPQDVVDKNALLFYHNDDLPYLRTVYKAIVREGGMSRCKPFRMMVQNGDFIKVETEWLSFINPWSKKLEFIVGKHYIVEGPSNPDVFQTPDPDSMYKPSEDEENAAKSIRDAIIRIMNEVLTKPAEVAKQQMSKRCQDLTSFMESLMEDAPKNEDELRVELHDPDSYESYTERDSVMLGEISPHHDHNSNSKSSTETPLSYNQLNYNETLQRFFESHQPFSADRTVMPMNSTPNENNAGGSNVWISSTDQNYADTRDVKGCSSGHSTSNLMKSPDYKPIRLTEALIIKHNSEMEKEFFKKHRENRSSKSDRERHSTETYLKKEHLNRCNASFQPTSAEINQEPKPQQPHGVKRSYKHASPEASTHKHHCSALRQPLRGNSTTPTNTTPASDQATPAQWGQNNVGSMNAVIFGVGIPQQMSIMGPVMPGIFPMYYAPTPTAGTIPAQYMPQNKHTHNKTNSASYPAPMQCMIYGQAVYAQPFMYSPISQPVVPVHYSLPRPKLNIPAVPTFEGTNNTLGLTRSNYEEARKISVPMKPAKNPANQWREKQRHEAQSSANKLANYGSNLPPNNALHRSKEAVRESSLELMPKPSRLGNRSDEKTDEESSYSSFYSSFFKTESGSAEDSCDAKKSGDRDLNRLTTTKMQTFSSYYGTQQVSKVSNIQRKMEPPWLEQVSVTPNLIYKYQVITKSMEEVLNKDKIKMQTLEQPGLVNEQLSQLYLDLQLEGVASRLTLEEGITSSSSSGEETTSKSTKMGPRRKREYSKLVMIYEEDTPLPPPPATECNSPTPGTSAS